VVQIVPELLQFDSVLDQRNCILLADLDGGVALSDNFRITHRVGFKPQFGTATSRPAVDIGEIMNAENFWDTDTLALAAELAGARETFPSDQRSEFIEWARQHTGLSEEYITGLLAVHKKFGPNTTVCLNCCRPIDACAAPRIQVGFGLAWICASCVDAAAQAVAQWRMEHEAKRQAEAERQRLERCHAPLTREQTIMVRRALTRLPAKYRQHFLDMMHEETRGHETVDDDFVRDAIEALVADLISNGPFVMEEV
jgi:hypothetical protein